jgi:glycosyltransferase involved in cell wall biosynthesis
MATDTSPTPLVSVGIPAYNRPEGLRRTLAAMRGQTWQNLEIVISDNASPDPEVEAVGRAAAAADPRVRYFRQDENAGGPANFRFVLEKATGEFFLWAADDDAWEPFFIERCVEAHLALGPGVAVVQMAVPVTFGDTVLPRLDQERAFAAPIDGSASDRIAHFLRHSYANVIYGVFRRSALYTKGKLLIDVGKELQVLVYVAANGEVIALPEVGMYKGVRHKRVYEHQLWEIEGGIRPQWWRPRNIPKMLRYHREVLESVRDALKQIDLGEDERAALDALATRILRRHALSMAINWMPPKAKRQSAP